MLVLIGATPEGKKGLVGFQAGTRESAQSWRELLIDTKRRGLSVAPRIAVGDGALEMTLRRAGEGYVLGVNRNSEFHSWNKPVPFHGSAEKIAAGLDETDWKRLSAGVGTKGPRLYDWAYCELADLDGPASGDGPVSRWTRGLLIRRTIADGALAYFSTWCPKGTGLETSVHVEGHRWSVEDDFKTGKNEFGLDHNETRSWHGWHRHVSLSMLALAMMCAVRHRANLADHLKDFCDSVG